MVISEDSLAVQRSLSLSISLRPTWLYFGKSISYVLSGQELTNALMTWSGADVTHSRSYDKSEPSVAAVVASMDPNASTYACEVKMQGHRQEMIQVCIPCKRGTDASQNAAGLMDWGFQMLHISAMLYSALPSMPDQAYQLSLYCG